MARVTLEEPIPRNAPFFEVFFSGGYRPFFLGACAYSVINLLAWLTMYSGWGPSLADYMGDALPPVYWHAHEMLYGFVAAAISGFLLTAVPNWVGRPPYRGRSLQLLFGVWLLGRLAFWAAPVLSPWLVAAIDLLFLLMPLKLVAPALLQEGMRKRQGIFIYVLFAYWLFNLLFHLETLDLLNDGWRYGTRGATAIVALLITIIGGRIIPNFTRNALRRDGKEVDIHTPAQLDKAAFLSTAAFVPCYAFASGSSLSAIVAGIVAVIHILRCRHWGARYSLHDPLVWILHAGYSALILGFVLEAAHLLPYWLGTATTLHAFTAGAFGLMIIAVMTRATLGHSGRPLEASKLLTLAYWLVLIGAALRVIGPLILSDPMVTVVLSGLLWAAGFGLTLIDLWPCFVKPRSRR